MKNLIVRALVGGILVAVIITATYFSPYSYIILFTLISALCAHEFASIINTSEKAKINKGIITLAGGYLFLASALYSSNITRADVFIPYILILLYLMISELYLKSETSIANWAFTMLSQVYTVFPFALLNLLAFQTTQEVQIIAYNPILPLAVFIFLWVNDSGAYLVGSSIGKHRLFERISPKKSWEGSVGGAFFTLIAAWIISLFFPFLPLLQWLILALVVVVFGTWGDLSESLLKRTLGIKDSSHILPGHGGFLDRFDSALMAIPAAVICLYLFNLIGF
ncbi:MAG: phosphatidate cytidylyltransferase [Bacteroidales bacterium]|nr:phosphatidate cytidylyltransferase [Bacteroidales bacterium]